MHKTATEGLVELIVGTAALELSTATAAATAIGSPAITTGAATATSSSGAPTEGLMHFLLRRSFFLRSRL